MWWTGDVQGTCEHSRRISRCTWYSLSVATASARRGSYAWSFSSEEERTISSLSIMAMEEEGPGEHGRRCLNPKEEPDPPAGIKNQPLWPDLPIILEITRVAMVVRGERSDAAEIEGDERCVWVTSTPYLNGQGMRRTPLQCDAAARVAFLVTASALKRRCPPIWSCRFDQHQGRLVMSALKWHTNMNVWRPF